MATQDQVKLTLTKAPAHGDSCSGCEFDGRYCCSDEDVADAERVYGGSCDGTVADPRGFIWVRKEA